ncbi:MAG: alpha-E domain-containing protein [Magnetococcales bacterium]|nr:alpha-E domain-containing protein [Magnetococcales bacterium]
MLSRVAEHIYWLARHLDRVENTARLFKATEHLLLDMPEDIIHRSGGWEQLAAIIGISPPSDSAQRPLTREGMIHYFVNAPSEHMETPLDNPGSLAFLVENARNNLRVIRGVFPTRTWTYVEQLRTLVDSFNEESAVENRSTEMFEAVIQQCEKINGMLCSSMSHDLAYDFYRMGQNIERADMLTRILDVRGVRLFDLSDDPLHQPFENSQWRMVIRAVNGLQMYRQSVSPRIQGPQVLRFILQNTRFPRALRHCILVMEGCIKDMAYSAPIRTHLRRLEEKLFSVDLEQMQSDSLHRFLDDLQTMLAALHDTIQTTYFRAAVTSGGRFQTSPTPPPLHSETQHLEMQRATMGN